MASSQPVTSSAEFRRHLIRGANDPKDVVSFDVPALIRVLEIAREELGSDDELHVFVENVLSASKNSASPLTAQDIASIPLPSDGEPADEEQH